MEFQNYKIYEIKIKKELIGFSETIVNQINNF